MSHVLPMAASQLSHPISVFVLVIPGDRLLHNPLCYLSNEWLDGARHHAQDGSIRDLKTDGAGQRFANGSSGR